MFIGSDVDPEISFDPSEFMVDYEFEPVTDIDLSGECRKFFSPGGILASASAVNGSAYEERPQQLQMSLAVAEALSRSCNACIEAPTGVGKSFAYLLPLIHYAVNRRRPALISTETINLQHQLIEKDLPFLREMTGMGFSIALAKGRSNYLCRRRLALLDGEYRDELMPSPKLAMETARIVENLSNGRDSNYLDGVRDNSAIWHMICSESGNCAGPKCEYYGSCYYFKARRKWDEADIVVANHALFLTDLAIRAESGSSGTLLPDYGAVLLDEAHTLENCAAMHLGVHISRNSAIGLMNRLYNHEHTRGLLMRGGEGILELRASVQRCREELYKFFMDYEALLEKNSVNSLRLDEHKPEPFPEMLVGILNDISYKLQSLAEIDDDENFKTEISSNADRCAGLAEMISLFAGRGAADSVYFVEKDGDSISCHAAPLNVAQLLGTMLFNGEMPVILCSATLTVAGSFDYFVSRSGFAGGEMLRLDSPFSPSQAKLLVSGNMPEPSSPEYLAQLAKKIGELVTANNGNAFVLFTSYQSMKYCTQALEQVFALRGMPLFVQGGEMSRQAMLCSFRSAEHPVLFGTDSFWTGVDMPGDSLTLVIITRLPFASPGAPVTSARMEKIEKSGNSSFFGYSLPEAVLKFRQGAGRLIRTAADHGTIAVLDSRIVKRSYGRSFINSLPYNLEYM